MLKQSIILVKDINWYRSFLTECKHRTTHLQLHLTIQLDHAVQLHQRTELRVRITERKLSVLEFDLGVHSRDWNVLKSDFTLMSSTYFDRISILATNHMKTSLFFAFFSFIHVLEDNVGPLGADYSNHLHIKALSLAHHSWERLLADLTLEFSEVVWDYHASDFLLDLTINPLF